MIKEHFFSKYSFRLWLLYLYTENSGYMKENGEVLGRLHGILNILILSSQSSWPHSLNHTFGFLKDRFERQAFDWQVLMGSEVTGKYIRAFCSCWPLPHFLSELKGSMMHFCCSIRLSDRSSPRTSTPPPRPKTTYYILLLWSVDTSRLIKAMFSHCLLQLFSLMAMSVCTKSDKLCTTSAKWCLRYKHSHPSEAWSATYN